MGKKKLKCDGIYFVGENANDVTGSQTLVIFNGKKYLFECGMYQCNDYLESYQVNSKSFKYNPSEIDYVFVGHAHIDHVGLLPRLVAKGFKGKIIASYETAQLLETLLMNSCFILADEARVLSKRYERDYEPLYTEDDVYRMLDFVYEFDKDNYTYKLDDNVSFRFLKNSHCLGAKQIQLILTDDNGKETKILYTSDIGSFNSNNHYMDNTEICTEYNDYTIMESTYGERTRVNNKTREFDLEKIKSACLTVLERGGTAIFPAFSFSRSQEILTNLYEIFHNDKTFTYNIVVDSKLTCQICDKYYDLLKGDNLKLWKNVCDWENVNFAEEKEDSDGWLKDTRPKICISASGFCVNGRIVKYLQNYLGDDKNMVVISGYSGSDPSYLSYRIRNYKDYPTLKINHSTVDNKADCITLGSFSSHANRNDLITMGSKINTGKLILVHGSKKAENELKEDLDIAIEKENKTHRVIVSQKDMVVHF